MFLKKWDQLPRELQNDQVRVYYDILSKKKLSLFVKRAFDIVASSLMLIILSPFFLVLSALIVIDSREPVFFRQERVTQYNKKFRIFKFRSMYIDSEKGSQVTLDGDSRITSIGKFIRKYRLDEISQLIDIFRGTMSFVGTRPEVVKYTSRYTDEMMATMLLPAGVTSTASVYFKDESVFFNSSESVDDIYVNSVLPVKMHYNLEEIKNFSLFNDVKVMFMTVFAMLGKNYESEYVTRSVEKAIASQGTTE